jgi:hypothetical protein
VKRNFVRPKEAIPPSFSVMIGWNEFENDRSGMKSKEVKCFSTKIGKVLHTYLVSFLSAIIQNRNRNEFSLLRHVHGLYQFTSMELFFGNKVSGTQTRVPSPSLCPFAVDIRRFCKRPSS